MGKSWDGTADTSRVFHFRIFISCKEGGIGGWDWGSNNNENSNILLILFQNCRFSAIFFQSNIHMMLPCWASWLENGED